MQIVGFKERQGIFQIDKTIENIPEDGTRLQINTCLLS